GLEARPVLDHVGHVGPGGQVAQVQAQVAQDLQDFLALLGVARPDHQHRRHHSPSFSAAVCYPGSSGFRQAARVGRPGLTSTAAAPLMKGEKGGSLMSTATRCGAYTFEDFCCLVKDGQKADLINGVIHMASTDNWDANKLFAWLFRLLGDFVDERDLGEVCG